MDVLLSHPLQALILSNAALVFGASIALLRFQRLVRQNREFWDSPTGATVQADTVQADTVQADTVQADDEAKDRLVGRNAQATGDAEAVLAGFLECRLAKIHERLDDLADRIERDTGSPPAAEPLFSHAVRLAQNGASAADLVKACGLNEAEARLMCRLHARSAA